MKLSKSFLKVLVGVLLLVLAADARQAFAQMGGPERPKSFLSVNIGAQPKARDYTVVESFPAYDETALIQTLIGTGGKAIFDISGGYRVWRDFSAGLGFSSYGDSSSTTALASVPDSLAFDFPQPSAFPLDVLDHSERAIHLSVVYVVPIVLIEKMEVAVFAGPSFFTLNKELPGAGTVAPGSSTLTGVDIVKFNGGATGLHVGADVSYMVTPMFGAGVFLRAGSASVDVPNVEGGKVDVGGFNFGIGGRVRF